VGALDPSFGTGGLVTTTFGGTEIANAAAIQPDGKIVVVGSTTSGNDFAVARYNPDGTLDTSFGGDGKFDFTFGGTDVATDVAIQSDGRIVVVGHTTVGNDFAVARVLADGSSLDNSFSGDGKQFIDFGGTDKATAVAIRPNGRIVVGGFTTTNNDFAVAQLEANGNLDGLFGPAADGKFRFTFGGTDIANDLVIQSDGNIVMVGFTDAGAGVDDDFAIARVLANGSALDAAAFGTGGKVLVEFGGDDEANGVALQSDGFIVVAGSTSSNNDYAIARLDLGGGLDGTFSGDGKVAPSLGGLDVGTDVAIQADGKIVVVGRTNQGGAPADNFGILRLNIDGSNDTSFDTDGIAFAQFGGDDEANGVAIDPNGRIVAVGSTTANNDFAVARFIGTVEKGPNLAVGGSLDNKAGLFVPDPTGAFPLAPTATLSAFGAGTNNVRTAVADVNGDGVADTILVTGPGVPIRFAVVSGTDNTTLLVPPTAPFAGSEDFTGGGFVSAADFNNDGRAEMVFTPDLGGGPRVTIFSLPVSGTPTVLANFFGITGDPNFRGGARTGAGDVNGDGFADLGVSAGFQGGPRIALFDGTTLATTPTKLLNDFFAFEDTLRNGAYLSIGDLNGDGFGDLAFGAGPGGAPRLLVISGQQTLVAGPEAAILTPLANFFVAGNADDRGGVRVAFNDADGDNLADLAVGSGEGSPANVRAYLGKDFTTTAEPAAFQDITVFGGGVLDDGVFVG
jgi:uncharacterized delta-60 repeat protein